MLGTRNQIELVAEHRWDRFHQELEGYCPLRLLLFLAIRPDHSVVDAVHVVPGLAEEYGALGP